MRGVAQLADHSLQAAREQADRKRPALLAVPAASPHRGAIEPVIRGEVAFGRYTLRPARRELLAEGRRIEVGERAFDALVALIEAHGRVVTKDELLERVWPGKIVEENNLQVQIATLRKAFEQDRELIRTVAGRGYQFVGELGVVMPADVARVTRRSRTNLSQSPAELIGRDGEIATVMELVRDPRVVTLTGPGGIGKTRLCMEVGRRLLDEMPGGVWMVELGPLSDPALVPVTVATALGLTLASAELSPDRVAAAVAREQMLLILDSCEHVIGAAALMAEALVRASPLMRVLVTSREPLRTPGEAVYRVPPLDVPPEDAQHLDQILCTGAVRLFVARAHAAHPQFVVPDQRVAQLAAAVCRRLDGIPLAIELAAARTAALGLEGVAARLDDRFRLLTGGHRTALPRHQTLRATLDWSHELLAENERVVLRRLAVFTGGFSLESAAVVACQHLAAPDVVDCVLNLVTKSLLPAPEGPQARYRWLETTRAYAMEKLTESGEKARFACRHAQFHLELFQRAEQEWETRPTAEWLAAYGARLDNVRAALDWSFSPDGDAQLGVALAVAVVPLWMRMSLMAECRARIEQALQHVDPASAPGERQSMQLHAGLGLSLMYTVGNVEASRAALCRALQLAEKLDDTDYRLRALWALCVERLNSGVFHEALPLAQQFYSVAASSPNPMDLPIGDRMIGMALHWMGDQAGARRLFERMLGEYLVPVHRSQTLRFVLDQRVSARAVLAEVLWLQGFPDRALNKTASNIEEALATDHALSLCNALAKACPIALFAGDLDALERYAGMLLEHSVRNALASWTAEAHCFQAVLKVRRGLSSGDEKVLGPAVEELREIKFALRYTSLLGDLAELLGRNGEVERALQAIDEALLRSGRNHELWCRPELLRIKGELCLLAPDAGKAQAEQLFVEGLELARKQAVLSWELRCAMSLARLWQAQSREEQGGELLAKVYHRFTEGFDTADLRTARALLDALRRQRA